MSINKFTLGSMSDEDLNTVLSLPLDKRTRYFEELVSTYYPKSLDDDVMYISLIESYISSFYLEKIYRSNKFINEKFAIIYTDTGLIKNLTSEMYFDPKELLIH